MYKKILFIFFFLFSSSLIFANASPYTIIKDECDLQIVSPSLQERTTLKIKLLNGLEAYIVSDPQSPKSAAALAVHVGSWSDPQDRPGLAHFLEHLLFLGTVKYPEENGYARYLDQYGGNRNAFTAPDRTVYMFSVDNAGFKEALDRFAQFFVAPLFLASGIDREMKAIDQEFCKDQPLDPWRHHYVMKELANPKHPFHHFDIGNKETLKQISPDEVKSWYRSHYSADKMKLAITTSLSINEALPLITEYFGPILQHNTPKDTFSGSIFTQDKLNRLITMTPLRSIQTLDFTWEVPKQSNLDEEVKPEELIAFILGHEGEESLLAFLKEKGWADGLKAGCQKLSSKTQLLTLKIDLTTLGLNNVDQVISSVDKSLQILRSSEIPSTIFEEINTMALLKYQYQTRENVFEQVADWAYSMIDEPLSSFPKKTLMPTRFESLSVKQFLTHLTLENSLIILNANPKTLPYKNSKKERWMGVEYSVHPPFNKDLEKEKLQLTKKIIPEKNPFIPTKLAPIDGFCSQVLPEPSMLVDNNLGKLYFCKDQLFLTPEVAYLINFKSPLLNDRNIDQVILADLFCFSVLDQLSPLSVQAKQAGIDYSLDTAPFSLVLEVTGYSEKTSDFLLEVYKKIREGKISQEVFERNKEKLTRRYQNLSQSTPLKQGIDELYHILYKDHATYEEKEISLESISYEMFQQFVHKIFEQSYVEALFYGDLSETAALQVWSNLSSLLQTKAYPPSRHFHVELAALKLAQGPYLFSKKSKLEGNALLLVADLGSFNFKERAAQEILSKAMEEPFFSELRTKQQTAYIVSNWSKEIERELYAFFAIQSHSHDGRDLLSRFELFIEDFLQDINNCLPEKLFETIKESSLYALNHPYKDREDLLSLLKTLAFDYDGDFHWLNKRKKALEELTYLDFITLAKQFLGSENHQRLAIFVEGKVPTNQVLSYKKIALKKLKTEIEYRSRFQAISN